MRKGLAYITGPNIIPFPLSHIEDDLEYLLSLKRCCQKKVIYLLKAEQETASRCHKAIHLPREIKAKLHSDQIWYWVASSNWSLLLNANFNMVVSLCIGLLVHSLLLLVCILWAVLLQLPLWRGLNWNWTPMLRGSPILVMVDFVMTGIFHLLFCLMPDVIPVFKHSSIIS